MPTPLRALVDRALAALHARDLAAALDCFADDAVVVDPHYPEPEMRGRAAFASGLRWAFDGIERFGFTVDRWFEAPDGRSAAMEVSTHHVLKAGMELRFMQLFVVDTDGARITRFRAYTPHGPGGVGGAVLGATRLVRRLGRRGRA